MPEKFFLINPKIEYSKKEVIAEIANEQIESSAKAWEDREKKAGEAMHEECALKHVQGRAIIRVNVESKNVTTFAGGITFRRERRFNNFNFREVNPSNGFVISAENMVKGAEVLFDYTAMHDSNKIFDYKTNSNDVVYYSIKEEDCYAWRMGRDEWKPTPNYEFGLRCYLPYAGKLIGIQPTFLKDTLYITTGELKGKVVLTLKGCDYQIVFTDTDGREGNIIRINRSRDEIVCVSHRLTDKLNNGELLVGLSPNDSKIIL